MKRDYLTKEEAISVLPDGDKVHSFSMMSGPMMIGADWDRQSVIDAFDETEALHAKGKPIIDGQSIPLTGPTARAMGHGIAVYRGGRPYAIETVEERLVLLDTGSRS